MNDEGTREWAARYLACMDDQALRVFLKTEYTLQEQLEILNAAMTLLVENEEYEYCENMKKIIKKVEDLLHAS